MKGQIANYTFNASTKLVTIQGLGDTPKPESVLLITNTTRGVVYYNPFDQNKTATFGSIGYNGATYSLPITLNASVSTTGHSNDDKLHIVYDYPQPDGARFAVTSIGGRTQSGGTGIVALNTSSALTVDGSGVTQPVSNASLTNIDADIGATSDSAATTDTGTFSLIALFKRLLGKLPNLDSGRIPVAPVTAINDTVTYNGSVYSIRVGGANLGEATDSSATTDAGTFSLISLFKRLLSRFTTLLDRIPSLSSGRIPVDVGTSINVGEVEIKNDTGNPVPVSGAVTTSNLVDELDRFEAQNQDKSFSVTAQIAGQAYTGLASHVLLAGENHQSGTITLTNNVAQEISYGGDGVNGFNTVVLEINTSGVTFGSNNIVAQAHNQTGAPTDQQIMCPLGVRITHSADSTTGLNPSNFGTVGYVNLEPNTTFSGYYGTRLNAYENDASTQVSGLPATGTRFFIFDLTTSKFFLKANFTAGTITVNYRLYRTRHPAFSARKVVVSGEAGGAVRVAGSVDANVSGFVYMDGGYLDDTGSIYNAISDALNDTGVSGSGSQLGAATDASATTDTGTFSLISLFKRLLSRITTLVPANLTVSSTRLLVDGSGVTQPVSGTVTANGGDFAKIPAIETSPPAKAIRIGFGTDENWNGVGLGGSGAPLPVAIFDAAGAGDGISFTQIGGKDYANVNVGNSVTIGSLPAISGTVTANAGTGTFAVSAASLPLPSGAATSSNQATANTSLSNIDTDLGAQADASASSDDGTFSLISLFKRLLSRITSLVPANLTVTSTRLLVDGSGVTQPISGTVTASVGDGGSPTSLTSGKIAWTPGESYPVLNAVRLGFAGEETYNGVGLDSGGSPLPVKLYTSSDSSSGIGSSNPLSVSDKGATGEATVSSFTSTTSATLKSSNSSRKLLTIYNEGAGNLHVLYGSGTASTTNYSVKLSTGDYLEIEKYTGQVNAIFATAGTARVTEIT